jgi:hypothetical protein
VTAPSWLAHARPSPHPCAATSAAFLGRVCAPGNPLSALLPQFRRTLYAGICSHFASSALAVHLVQCERDAMNAASRPD